MSYLETVGPLIPGKYYHIYNRGNNKETIFKEADNYHYFLKLWHHRIDPVAETICYNLLPNHFHFFIRIRTIDERSKKTKSENDKLPLVERSFSNFFNAYTKSINKRFNRTGSLFQERFRRNLIMDSEGFKTIVGYILTNAVKHNICPKTDDYPYSSYKILLSKFINDEITSEVKKHFPDLDSFIKFIQEYERKIKAQT